MNREQMNIVVVGHVDHGKSTMIGRLLADTHSLPKGKLEMVRQNCERNSKPFEYAFLLDALKDEQSQGITIDSARCFFKTKKRDYIIIDAPGHIEFLKNMITGAARAEAALLLIDAAEGIQENSRRHGYMLSMLGINQVVVCVNKMDLVSYDQKVYDTIERDYRKFLENINVHPRFFVPISGREGDNIAGLSSAMSWYKGQTVLDIIDGFEKEEAKEKQAFRFPVQDIYKFTQHKDDRRIFAGRIETGSIAVGDKVTFLPSQKSSEILSIEGFNVPVQKNAQAGQSTGVTLKTQIYVKPGELMVKTDELQPQVSSRFKANLFWLGKQPLVKNKQYKIKLGTTRMVVWLEEIHHVLDASQLTSVQNKPMVERHDVAECTFQTFKPIAFDLSSDLAELSRFVIVDNYEIAGGGIIRETLDADNQLLHKHLNERESSWERSRITSDQRQNRLGQQAALIIVAGDVGVGKQELAKRLEEELYASNKYPYYLGVSNSLLGMEKTQAFEAQRADYLMKLGEVAHLFTDAGQILLTTISDLDDYELDILKELNLPCPTYVVNLGECRVKAKHVDLQFSAHPDLKEALKRIMDFLRERKVI